MDVSRQSQRRHIVCIELHLYTKGVEPGDTHGAVDPPLVPDAPSDSEDSGTEEQSPKVHIVLAELIDGHTPDGEYFIMIAAYRDDAAAERRAILERALGRWGRFSSDLDSPSDFGWLIRVEPLKLAE
jgi:hypothetical protein